MPTIEQLRERSDGLFGRLLELQDSPPEAQGAKRGFAARPQTGPFSWFDPEQGVAAAALSFQLAALAASEEDEREGLGAALDRVEEGMAQGHPEQVRQGFALFVTHNGKGRRLAKPRTASAAPHLFSPPPSGGDDLRRISIGGPSPQLDYWREDVLANEHHQHWHEVYPFTGLPPRDFRAWIDERTQEELVSILDALRPDPTWSDQVAAASPEQLARFFAQVADGRAVFGLPPDLYRLLFHLNDRQGELFFYMHAQMLARYDAELLSAGLPPVEPFGPDAWSDPIAAGYDPEENREFGSRGEDEELPAGQVEWLTEAYEPLAEAIDRGRLRGADGNPVPIDRTNLGEAVEAAIGQLHGLDRERYPGIHNTGHMLLASLSEPNGVMSTPVAAIRDQVFWQWHKFIDGIGASWQAGRDPYEFDDAPDVLVRDSLAGSKGHWESPDIILCRTADLPAGEDPAQLGEELFGGGAWSLAAGADGGAVEPVDELVTTFASASFGGRSIRFLTHEPFSYFIRVENRAAEDLEVTARVFLAPAPQAENRRAWIEMDKFLVALPAGSKTVVYRSDTESSVVKRPVDRSPGEVQSPTGGGDEGSYCDCGWPYTLLLPRGTAEGAEYRLLTIFTDAAIDRVSAPTQCGSMSWCGAVDRYPDTRDMGYPFCRPFDGDGDAIRDTFAELDNAAARTVSIRHA